MAWKGLIRKQEGLEVFRVQERVERKVGGSGWGC